MEYLIAPTVNVKLSAMKDVQGTAYQRRVSTSFETLKSKDRTVVGIAAIFGNVDDVGDIVAPGAFRKAIEEFKAGRSRCCFLWSHKISEPPTAQILDFQEVSRGDLPQAYRGLLDVSGGLMVTRKYLDDPVSDRVYQGVVTKAIKEMSFMYDTVKFHIEKNSDGREIRVLDEVELLDCSDVIFGCNPLTMAGAKRRPEIVKASSIAGLQRLKDMRRELLELEAMSQSVNNPIGKEGADFDRWLKTVEREGKPLFPGSGKPLTSAQMRRQFVAAFGKSL